MKKVHLISNAHLDPIWQWEWEEGAAAAISTFRCAARFCREFDGYIFCHNESLIYQWVEEYEPSLFREIQALVKEGKWHIMGGWHVQPDCNMPSGEGFARQITSGRRYFKEKFDCEPTTAINFDPFGHTRGLVQLLAKSGYDSYLFCRPGQGDLPLESNTFEWVGYDGSSVLAQRSPSGYNTGLGRAVDKVRAVTEGEKESPYASFCLWGVGDHGGGPSRVDIRTINTYIDEWREKGVEIVHSTPEAYFHDVKVEVMNGRVLPRREGDLNSWAPGCYTSQVRIKQKYRETENMLFSTEKMVTHAVMLGKMEYPEDLFGRVLYDLLTVQFHDVLPGSSIQPAEDMAIRMLDHGYEYLTRIRNKAFLALADGQVEAVQGEIPILVYNPHPYEVTEDIMCEFMLHDQNWSGSFIMPTVYRDGVMIPTQCEKERSNIPLDWRKCVYFHATLAPMSMNRFDVRLTELPEKPKLEVEAAENGRLTFHAEKADMTVSIDAATGLISEWMVKGVNYLKENAGQLRVMWDLNDSWGMTQQSYRNQVGVFSLLSPEEGSAFSDLDKVIPSVRIIESGDVRVVVEAVFGYEESKAVVRYAVSMIEPQIDVDVRLINATKRKLIKLAFPTAFENPQPVLEVSFGEEPMLTNGKECVGQQYMNIVGDNGESLQIYNRGTYGSSFEDGVANLTLLHSPGYTAHPIGDRKTLPEDRFSEHMEQGERLFKFRLVASTADDEQAAQKALNFNESPVAISFFPSGEQLTPTKGDVPFMTMVDTPVIMTALKKTMDGEDWMVRFFNPTKHPQTATVESELLGLDEELCFGPYEIKTFRIQNGELKPARVDEKLI